MQHAAATATARTRLSGQRLVHTQQQSEKIGVWQKGMAHLSGLLAW